MNVYKAEGSKEVLEMRHRAKVRHPLSSHNWPLVTLPLLIVDDQTAPISRTSAACIRYSLTNMKVQVTL